MKTVALTRVVSDHDDTTIKIDPSHGFAVGACFTDSGAASDLCMVLTAFGSFKVRGTVEEVSAALESATAPPVAAAVEVAPTDLERAADILRLFAYGASETDYSATDDAAVDRLLGVSGSDWGETASALKALAAKLRGGG